jgi:hypothetical protein
MGWKRFCSPIGIVHVHKSTCGDSRAPVRNRAQQTNYVKVRGTQAPSVNNGATVRTVTLKDRDGIMIKQGVSGQSNVAAKEMPALDRRRGRLSESPAQRARLRSGAALVAVRSLEQCCRYSALVFG